MPMKAPPPMPLRICHITAAAVSVRGGKTQPHDADQENAARQEHARARSGGDHPATSEAMPQASAWMENKCATAGSVVDRSRLIRFMKGAGWPRPK